MGSPPNWMDSIGTPIGTQPNNPTTGTPMPANDPMLPPKKNWMDSIGTPIGAQPPGSNPALAQGVTPSDKPKTLMDTINPVLDKAYSMGQSALVGGVKGVANVADQFITPTLQDINPGNENTFRDIADRYLPEPRNKVIGAGAEGTVTGSAFGPAAAVVGGASTAGSELLNQVRPEQPLANALEPLAAATLLAPGTIKNIIKLGRLPLEGVGAIKRDPLVQAKIDQGITAGTPASTTDSEGWRKIQRGGRESLFGGSRVNTAIENEQQQLEGAVTRNADNLAPASTTQELGGAAQQGIRDGVQQVKDVISSAEQRMDAIRNPRTTMVDMVPFVDRAIAEIAPEIGHARGLAGNSDGGATIVERLMENVIDLQQHTGVNGNPLRILDIRKLKQGVGDQLEQSLLNGDQSKRQLRQMYGILSDAEDAGYVGTPQHAERLALKAAEHEFYNTIESIAEPLVKDGMRPAQVAKMLTGEMRVGDTRLQQVFQLIDQTNPGFRDQYSSAVLRGLGRDNTGDFSPDRFFKNWQRLAPEAKATMFGDINGDIPKAYDQLALIAENQARGAKAIQPSQTAGTLEIFKLMSTFGAVIGGGTGYVASKLMNEDEGAKMRTTGQVAETGLGAGAGALLMDTIGYAMMGRLMTNRAFIRWLATPTPMAGVPMHLKALGGIAAESQNKDDVNAFRNYAEKAFGNQTSSPNDLPANRMPEKKAEGGPIDAPKSGFLSGGIVAPPSGGSFGLSNKYAGGGSVSRSIIDFILLRTPQPIDSYDEGEHIPGSKSAPIFHQEWNAEPDNYVRERELFERLNNRETSPVWPHNVGFEDQVFNTGNAKGYAMGGPVDGRYNGQSNNGQEMPEFEVGQYAEGGSVNNSNGSQEDLISKVVSSLTNRFPNMTPEAARGAAKYMYINESKLDPNIVNKESGAYGLGQHLGSRKTALFNKFGNKPSFDQQMTHIGDELQTSERGVLDKLLAAGKNEKAAYDVWGRDFERPGTAALAKAGVAYDPKDIKAYGNTNNSMMASNASPGNSIIDQFVSSSQGGNNGPSDDTTEPVDSNIQAWHSILQNADWIKPATKMAIKEVLDS